MSKLEALVEMHKNASQSLAIMKWGYARERLIHHLEYLAILISKEPKDTQGESQ